MNAYISYLYSQAIDELEDIKSKNDQWKAKILKEYRDSVNLPRKQKKRLRKSLQLEWNLANYNPFEF